MSRQISCPSFLNYPSKISFVAASFFVVTGLVSTVGIFFPEVFSGSSAVNNTDMSDNSTAINYNITDSGNQAKNKIIFPLTTCLSLIGAVCCALYKDTARNPAQPDNTSEQNITNQQSETSNTSSQRNDQNTNQDTDNTPPSRTPSNPQSQTSKIAHSPSIV